MMSLEDNKRALELF